MRGSLPRTATSAPDPRGSIALREGGLLQITLCESAREVVEFTVIQKKTAGTRRLAQPACLQVHASVEKEATMAKRLRVT